MPWGCRYPMLLSGALAAPLRRIDGGLYIDVLARIIHSRRSLDEVAVSCITATGVKCPLPLLETGWRSKCVVRNSRIYFVGHETQAFNARETRTCICRRPCYIMQSNVWNVAQVHRTLSFLGTGHTIILSSSLQENVRSLLPVNLQRNNILTARRNQCWRKMTT